MPSFLKNPWVLFAVGVLVGGTVLSNRVASLPFASKIPKV